MSTCHGSPYKIRQPKSLLVLVYNRAMRAQIAIICSVIGFVVAAPAQQPLLPDSVLRDVVKAESKSMLPISWPGIDLDLSERRLVQFEGSNAPVWMTELDKVSALARSGPIRALKGLV